MRVNLEHESSLVDYSRDMTIRTTLAPGATACNLHSDSNTCLQLLDRKEMDGELWRRRGAVAEAMNSHRGGTNSWRRKGFLLHYVGGHQEFVHTRSALRIFCKNTAAWSDLIIEGLFLRWFRWWHGRICSANSRRALWAGLTTQFHLSDKAIL